MCIFSFKCIIYDVCAFWFLFELNDVALLDVIHFPMLTIQMLPQLSYSGSSFSPGALLLLLLLLLLLY